MRLKLAKYHDQSPQYDDLRDIGHGAAHLIHGSSEGRFRIYSPAHLTAEDAQQVGYHYLDYQIAIRRYEPNGKSEGHYTTADGEEYYFIPSPATGLWATREKIWDR